MSDTSPSTQSDEPPSQLGLPNKTLFIGLLVILSGAMLMLIALSQDWYTVRCAGEGCDGWENGNIDFDLLNNPDFREFFGLNWAGTFLPIISMIVCASIAILSAVYSVVTGQRLKKLWGWLCLLSVAALISNFLYLLVSFITLHTYYDDITLYVTPHVGRVLAFIGAIAIGLGSRIKSHS